MGGGGQGLQSMATKFGKISEHYMYIIINTKRQVEGYTNSKHFYCNSKHDGRNSQMWVKFSLWTNNKHINGSCPCVPSLLELSLCT